MEFKKRHWTFYIYIVCLIILFEINSVHTQRTFLDKFINGYRKFRVGLFKFVGRSDTDAAYLWSLKRQVTGTKPNSRKNKTKQKLCL